MGRLLAVAFAARCGTCVKAGKRGLGTAYITGFRWALDHGYDYCSRWTPIARSRPPKGLSRHRGCRPCWDRYLGGSRWSTGRSRGSCYPCGEHLARWVIGLSIWDLTGGFKCFRRQVLEAIDLSQVRSNGYAFQIEMSARAWRKKFRLKEIPIVFVDRTEGQSKMNRTIVREAIWMVPRLRLMAWSGRI